MGKRDRPTLRGGFTNSARALYAVLENATLISIDTEASFKRTVKGMSDDPDDLLGRQIGISTFDMARPDEGIKTHCFMLGTDEYCAKIQREGKSLFADATRVEDEAELQQRMDDVWQPRGEKEETVILLGHGLENDMVNLHKWNLSFTAAHIVDTARFAMTLLSPEDLSILTPARRNNPSLGGLGRILGVTMPHRHQAGNDARYCMLAFLGLLARWEGRACLEDNDRVVREIVCRAWEVETGLQVGTREVSRMVCEQRLLRKREEEEDVGSGREGSETRREGRKARRGRRAERREGRATMREREGLGWGDASVDYIDAAGEFIAGVLAVDGSEAEN